MLALVLSAFLLVVAADEKMTLDLSIIDKINSDPSSSWTAGVNEKFADGFNTRMFPEIRKVPADYPIKSYPVTALPPNFDPNTKWPGCIGPVLDQGRCGSCWAFGGTEAISDRMCIHGNGTFLQLAPLDVVTCDMADAGCDGGSTNGPWDFAKSQGIVTEACRPYNKSIPTCPPAQEPCMNFVQTPACVKKCDNGADYESDKHKISTVYGLGNANDIATDIMTNGPVEAAFEVYEDFLSYKSGVYVHKTGQYLGGHAIKVIGFGTDNSTNQEYWVCQNSWTTTWGDNGFFWILRGKNECGIESSVVGGMP